MKPVLLTDFGSTYTKLTAIDLDAARILGTAQSYTTVAEDVRIGFQKALDALLAQTGPLTFAQSFACSSAAGGLRMMVSGLVPELTMEAARLASLGAGAKIVGQFSFELTQDDLETIQRVNPDIFLLVGGTDGGNSACVIHNAQMLATIRPQFPIVLAGNRTAMQQCRKALEGCEVSVCENVMPKFGVLKTEDTQKTIRSIFLRRIVQAKGLSAAAEQMSGPMMPTPAAVMQAMTLLAKGTDKTPGIGELIGVDVGGATTDVYSIAEGMPRQMNGAPSASYSQIRPLVERLRKELPGVRVELFDERFTSVLAQRAIIEGGVPKSRRRHDKGLVDRVSATIILQGYMESAERFRADGPVSGKE